MEALTLEMLAALERAASDGFWSGDKAHYFGPVITQRLIAMARSSLADRWSSIESAPKDGTNVLLVNRKGNMATGLWQGDGGREGWWLRGGSEPDVFFNGAHGPTHWMPLPQPPKD